MKLFAKIKHMTKHQRHQLVISISIIASSAVIIFLPDYVNHATVVATIVNVFATYEV